MFRISFVLLCVAQIIHYSRHLYALDMRLREEARANRMRNTVNWNNAPQRGRRTEEGVLEKLSGLFSGR